LTIDGLTASSLCRPASIEELSELMAAQTGSIVPVGAETQQHFGNYLRSADCAVDLTRLNRITEYVPGDLTIHVETGVRLADVQRALAENGQFLPLDPWNGPSATLGGIAATNAQGAYRTTGTIRDWIIGMKVVEADGTISRTGGRVVKNVTGYDLAKLYTGSIGTLAIIAEISLKVRSAYGSEVTAIARAADLDEAGRLLSSIRKSALQPVSCVWLGPENEFWLRFGEHSEAVAWQLKNLPAADWRVVRDSDQSRQWDLVRRKYEALGPVMLKIIGSPSTTPQIVGQFQPPAWIAHPLIGTVLIAVSDHQLIPRIRQQYPAVIERAPLEVRRQVATFGLTAAEHVLMRKMKDAFDPEGRLNPGRHVDGEAPSR
jgi:glycolate oxidase FAD binding subunit